MKRLAVLTILTLAAGVALAQEGGPPPRGLDNERVFFQAQLMRAIDEKATLLIEQGKPDLAIPELEKALAIQVPAWHPVYELKARISGRLASAYLAAGRKNDAVALVQKLLVEVPPGTPAEAEACLEAGTVFKQAGMPEEALKAFDRAITVSQKLAEGGRPSPPRPPGGRPPHPANPPEKGNRR